MSIPPGHAGSDPPDLAELARLLTAQQRELDQQQRELEQLRTDVHLLLTEVTDTFAALNDRSSRPGAAGPETGGNRPRGWRDLCAADSAALWGDLAGWLGWLHTRFPLLGRLPPCWWRHPAAVEHLTALHATWSAAYEEPAAPPAARADWLDHRLPATLAALRDWLPRGCLNGDHTPDPPTRYGRAIDDPAAYPGRTPPAPPEETPRPR